MPGADADGAEARPRGRGRGDLPQMGARFRGDRPGHRNRPIMVLKWNGETAADIPLAPLADEAPCYDRPLVPTTEPAPLADVPESTDIAADLLKLMASPDLASRRWIWEQYDQKVGADTVQRAGRRRRDGPRPRHRQGARDHHRLHAALLLCRPGMRAASRRSPKPIATSARSARPRSPPPTA